MKNKIAKILFAISVIAAPLAARADLIWYEGFNFTAPVIISGTNNFNLTNCSPGLWINISGNGLHDMYINTNGNNKLEVAATSAPNGIDRKDDDARLFATAPGSSYTNHVQMIYASFTVICTNLPNGAGSYFATIYNTASSGGGFFGRIQAFTNGTVVPNTWRLGVTGNTLAANPANGGYPVDLALNTPYQVVEELDPITLLAATIWVNPINLSDTGSTPNEIHYTSSDSIGTSITTTNPVNAFVFRQASSFGNAFFLITNLAVATTFAEATTNVWATNARPPVIVYQPVLGVTNYVGASFSLSVVANGQGLGNLTYQWKQGGTNYTGGDNGPNHNILTVSSALATDSGDFTLVATTPYGLSVTSSVARVSISSAPVPPSFVTQPASQTVYKGQTAGFSTTVVSPGNLTFTWYSNNVVITAGQVDNGGSSSYVLNNATASFAATYKVAVTNDVVANGIVSTNAVLTVLNPPAVSIAYLRTLVDPDTFLPTNTPPTIPYQVTGIITTTTNTTSGDTASYFLQDATGGINIFATAGSTFRPVQGDVVTFVGVMSSFSTTGLELFADTVGRTYTSYSIVSHNAPLPTPITIPFALTNTYGYAYVNTNIAGSLVMLNNVYFGTNAGTALPATGNTAVTVTNASGQTFKLQFFGTVTNMAGATLPSFAYSVTGVLYGFHPNYSVGITKFSDIVTNPPTPPPTIIPTNSAGITRITLVNGNVVITGTNAQTTGVYYLLASTNVALPLSLWIPVATNVLNTNGANGAFTFIGTNVVISNTGKQFYILSNTNANHP